MWAASGIIAYGIIACSHPVRVRASLPIDTMPHGGSLQKLTILNILLLFATRFCLVAIRIQLLADLKLSLVRGMKAFFGQLGVRRDCVPTCE